MKCLPKIFFKFAVAAAVITIGLVTTGCGECINGHVFEWEVTNAKYPAVSTQVCIRCGTTSANRETAIGDTGPAGGIVFYISADEFSLIGADFAAHYLEVSPADITAKPIEWASHLYFYSDVEGTRTEIGTGKDNTQKIIDAHIDDTESNYAAKACAQYNKGGKIDWFLPSKDELNALYESDIIATGSYWSSSQMELIAHGHNFSMEEL